MAFTGNYICTSFKKECLEALHNFTSDSFYIAFYDENATLNASTTEYTTENETTTSGYTAGGYALTVVPPSSGNGRAWASFEDLTIVLPPDSPISARGALIYNRKVEPAPPGGGEDTITTQAVCVLDFGRTVTANNEFKVTFPTADSINAIILIK